jgi:hypothetical protein
MPKIVGAIAAGPRNARNGFLEYCVELLALERPPYIEGEPSTWRQHSPHLAHALRAVGKILQPLLAKHDVETVVFER